MDSFNTSIRVLHDSDGGFKNDWSWKDIMDNCDSSIRVLHDSGGWSLLW